MTSQQIIHDHRTFRVVLQGMSHPGKVYSLPGAPETGAVKLLGCLMDHEVNFAVLDDRDMEAAITLHTGSRSVAPEEADYIIVCNGTTGGRLTSCRRGSLEYPDTGATVIYLVEELYEGDEGIVLSGPGVNGTISLQVKGLQTSEFRLLQKVNSEFPLGVDALFFDRCGRIACIPRSSRIGVN
jgi:alpha-D-ribose 1-methylphosphonate 5-triphosphate synthase subunit PhnH